jgi:hypothetical protein
VEGVVVEAHLPSALGRGAREKGSVLCVVAEEEDADALFERDRPRGFLAAFLFQRVVDAESARAPAEAAHAEHEAFVAEEQGQGHRLAIAA